MTLAVLALGSSLVAARQPVDSIQPTQHPPVPAQAPGYWLSPAAPAALTAALKDFARAVLVIDDGGDVASAAPLLASSALDATPLADHVRYYRGLVAQKQGRLDEAAALFSAVAASTTRSDVVEQALWRLAEIHELQGQYARAHETFRRLLDADPAQPDRVAHRLGVAAERAGDITASIAAHRIAYYDYPLSGDAAESGKVLERLGDHERFSGRLAKLRARADALFKARRWAPARAAYVELAAEETGAAHDVAEVRIGACDVQLKQYRSAAARLGALLGEGPHQAEAHYHHGLALRGRGAENDYVQSVRALTAAHPESPFTEDALDALAVWYVLRDEDALAAEVFGQIVQRFPGGRHAQRAAWKAGWWAYRQKQDAAAIAYFETGARYFPRSDYRPAWLYWSGRAKQRLGDRDGARERLLVAAADYKNSYYGRLALQHLDGPETAVPPNVSEAPLSRAALPTERVIGLLLGLGLHDLALAELRFARRVHGDSPALLATMALAEHRAGRLRPAINLMKRAYPQYLAAGGESLPPDVLRVLFPVDYFQQLAGSAKRRGLDPYLIVALAAQESTFDAGVRSSAGAIGLMQIMPATGRSLARSLGIRSFATRRLTDPETNMTLGTKYFADLVEQFGDAAYALAGYNAGGHRVTRWRAERPDLPLDEWIDDIPFPETQNYVKRILGTAEDYRRLYGGGVLDPASAAAPAPRAPAAPAPAAKRPAPKRPAAKRPAARTPAATTPARKAPPRRPAATRSTPAAKTPAAKAPATKVPVAKTPAAKTPAKKAPAKKAPATKAPAKKPAAPVRPG
ncbi:MAG: transglycosylase SLT domain-containing protein [Vicinamibacterales bacterium]